jgi:hypothetical protein
MAGGFSTISRALPFRNHSRFTLCRHLIQMKWMKFMINTNRVFVNAFDPESELFGCSLAFSALLHEKASDSQFLGLMLA